MDEIDKLKETISLLIEKRRLSQKALRARCVYLSKEGERQLHELVKIWGENPSATVRRALDIAYRQVTEKKSFTL